MDTQYGIEKHFHLLLHKYNKKFIKSIVKNKKVINLYNIKKMIVILKKRIKNNVWNRFFIYVQTSIG